jgi:hypothetical protein
MGAHLSSPLSKINTGINKLLVGRLERRRKEGRAS